MSENTTHRLTVGLLATALLSACASSPPVNSVATVAVQATVNLSDLDAQHSQAVKIRDALKSAGVGREEVAAGRVVRVACAMMTDGTWGGVGLLPQGKRAENHSVWRLRVLGLGDNDRYGVNPVMEEEPAWAWSGKAAYVFVPNWRELGRSSNLDRVPLPKAEEGRYHIVFSHYLVRCRP